jgi:hypothetical protein
MFYLIAYALVRISMWAIDTVPLPD